MKESQWVDLTAVAALTSVLLLGCVPARTRVGDSGSGPRPASATTIPAANGAHHGGSESASAPDDADYLRSRRLMVPVDGVSPSQVPNNFAARRGTRRHNALDIMAPRGTPVLAADDGRVLSIRTNNAGGRIIYLVDARERMIHYYAHLDGYRRGLREGARVAKGEVLGYVGTSGNAPNNVPHLHFQVMRYDDPARYWEGRPVNPHGLFAEEGRRRD